MISSFTLKQQWQENPNGIVSYYCSNVQWNCIKIYDFVLNPKNGEFDFIYFKIY